METVAYDTLTKTEFEAARRNGSTSMPSEVDQHVEPTKTGDKLSPVSGPKCSQCSKPAAPGRPTCGAKKCVDGHRRAGKRARYNARRRGEGANIPAPIPQAEHLDGSHATTEPGISADHAGSPLLGLLTALGPAAQIRSVVIGCGETEWELRRLTNGRSLNGDHG